MQFVKTDDLKTGMRLARPIYNKQGVMLYDRDSKLTQQGILSIRNFGLIGIFILEPAEPAPPMSNDDIDFERFQTVTVYLIEEEFQSILTTKKAPKMEVIVSSIIKEYGHLDKKINFIQNLRSKEDYIYKHALNTGILCAMITNRMNLKVDERIETVTAAVAGSLGSMGVPETLIDKKEMTESDEMQIYMAKMAALEQIDSVLRNGKAIKRICVQTENALLNFHQNKFDKKMKLSMAAKVLLVADTFEQMTAMQFGKEPESEVSALKYLQNNSDIFDEKVVKALVDSINLLIPGVSVELNTGDKALVLTENPENILRPMILCFKDNSMMDLSNREYDDVEIVDVMKTMDNRHIMDMNTLKEQGVMVPEE